MERSGDGGWFACGEGLVGAKGFAGDGGGDGDGGAAWVFVVSGEIGTKLRSHCFRFP